MALHPPQRGELVVEPGVPNRRRFPSGVVGAEEAERAEPVVDRDDHDVGFGCEASAVIDGLA